MQKGFSTIITLALVLIAVVTGLLILAAKFNTPKSTTSTELSSPTSYIATPTPNAETQSWKSYTDPNYHFSIRYPEQWIVSVDQTQNDNSKYHVFLHEKDPFGQSMQISVLSNPNHLTAQNYFKTVAFAKDLPEWNNTQRLSRNANLDGIDAIRIEGFTAGSGDRGPTAFVSKGDYIFEIICENPIPAAIDTFNLLLPTFRFN